MFRTGANKNIDNIVIIVAAGLFFTEGIVGQREIAGLMSEEHNMYNSTYLTIKDKEQLSKLEALKQNGAVALLPMPYFHYGSDYYLFEGSHESKRDAHTLSFHSGLPMLANVNPRVSLTESQSLIQIIAPDFFVKNIWSQVDENMQVFVIQSEGEMTRAEKLFVEQYGEVFTFRDQKAAYESIKASVKQRAQDSNNQNSHSYFHYNSFEKEVGGKKSGTTIPFIILDTIPGDSLKYSKAWIASAWLYFTDPNALTTALIVERYKGDSVLWVGRTHVATSHFQFQDSLLVEVPFEVEPGWNYRIHSKGSETDWADISFDHLLVRSDCTEIIFEQNGMFRYNNYLIGK